MRRRFPCPLLAICLSLAASAQPRPPTSTCRKVPQPPASPFTALVKGGDTGRETLAKKAIRPRACRQVAVRRAAQVADEGEKDLKCAIAAAHHVGTSATSTPCRRLRQAISIEVARRKERRLLQYAEAARELDNNSWDMNCDRLTGAGALAQRPTELAGPVPVPLRPRPFGTRTRRCPRPRLSSTDRR